MIIYISGPITGRTPEECEMKFNKAKRDIEKKGHIAISPWDIGKLLPVTFEHNDYMTVDLAIINKCDAVYFMNDWMLSDGCIVERKFCSTVEGSKKPPKIFDSIDSIPEARTFL